MNMRDCFLMEDEEEARMKRKNRIIGFFSLFGHLHIRKIIPFRRIQGIVSERLMTNQVDYVECVCSLLNVTGKHRSRVSSVQTFQSSRSGYVMDIYSPRGGGFLDQVIPRLSEIEMKIQDECPRVAYMIRDLRECRERGWIPTKYASTKPVRFTRSKTYEVDLGVQALSGHRSHMVVVRTRRMSFMKRCLERFSILTFS